MEDEFGCTGRDTVVVSISSTDALKEWGISRISVYPNPFTDYLFIDFDGLPAEDLSYSIIDINGKIHIKKGILMPKTEIYLQALDKGTYLLILEAGKRKLSLPLVKQ